LDESDNIVVFEDNNDEVNSFIKIHNWLVDNVEYIECRDNTYDDCAFGAIVTKKANSKGVSTALSVLCKIAGIPCLVVPGTKNGITHYWNYVKLDGAWRFVDASLNHADENDSYKYRYFLRKIPVSYIKSYSVPKIMVSDENYIKYGKVSGNEDITANDAAIVLEMALNQDYMDKCSSISIIEADVTGDGIITSEDASEILSKSSNYDFKFSVESKLDKYR
jgi:hypothetical protein